MFVIPGRGYSVTVADFIDGEVIDGAEVATKTYSRDDYNRPAPVIKTLL